MTSPHERLDQAMDARRLDLGLRWREVADRAKVNEATLRAIRIGTNQPSRLSKRRIEEALQWASGSVDAVMSGGRPTPLGEDLPMELPEESSDEGGQVLHNPRNIEAIEGWLANLRDRYELEDDPDERDTIARVITKIVRYTGVAPPPPPDEAQRRPGRRAG